MRDVCDIALALRVEAARAELPAAAMAAVMGGGEFVDPVRELFVELEADTVARPDRALRQALGLSS